MTWPWALRRSSTPTCSNLVAEQPAASAAAAPRKSILVIVFIAFLPLFGRTVRLAGKRCKGSNFQAGARGGMRNAPHDAGRAALDLRKLLKTLAPQTRIE